VYAPLAGTVVAGNDAAVATPEDVNKDAYSAWLFKLTPADPAAVDAMMDARGYQSVIAEE
jgi:glycine cleavage system H protein